MVIFQRALILGALAVTVLGLNYSNNFDNNASNPITNAISLAYNNNMLFCGGIGGGD